MELEPLAPVSHPLAKSKDWNSCCGAHHSGSTKSAVKSRNINATQKILRSSSPSLHLSAGDGSGRGELSSQCVPPQDRPNLVLRGKLAQCAPRQPITVAKPPHFEHLQLLMLPAARPIRAPLRSSCAALLRSPPRLFGPAPACTRRPSRNDSPCLDHAPSPASVQNELAWACAALPTTASHFLKTSPKDYRFAHGCVIFPRCEAGALTS
jgi:hypothetical protein